MKNTCCILFIFFSTLVISSPLIADDLQEENAGEIIDNAEQESFAEFMKNHTTQDCKSACGTSHAICANGCTSSACHIACNIALNACIFGCNIFSETDLEKSTSALE